MSIEVERPREQSHETLDVVHRQRLGHDRHKVILGPEAFVAQVTLGHEGGVQGAPGGEHLHVAALAAQLLHQRRRRVATIVDVDHIRRGDATDNRKSEFINYKQKTRQFQHFCNFSYGDCGAPCRSNMQLNFLKMRFLQIIFSKFKIQIFVNFCINNK